MSEQQPEEPEKTRRSRSFGSFLLFLVVLIVVLLIVGDASGDKPDTLTQDQFQHYLHSGRIVSLKAKGSEAGTNLITGTYKKPHESGDARFEVSYSTIEGREEEFQRLNAIGNYRPISVAELRAGVEDGWITPKEARSVITYQQIDVEVPDTKAAKDGEERKAQVTTLTKTKWEDELYVTALAKPSPPDLRDDLHYLPDRSGHVYYDVTLDGTEDLASLFAMLETRGAQVRTFNFNVTPKSGSVWAKDSSLLSTFLIYYGPWILIFVVFMIFMRQMRAQGGAGGVMSFGRSRATLYTKESHTNVTFDDVAGAEEAKSEVREIVEFLKNPSRFTRIGGRIPRGVLLVGPPGCGKTLLAKAIAGEAEVPFFSISGSDFVEMFVGVGASRVRDLFKQARDNSPCIIFLDEIDAVGRRRGSGMGGGHDEREQTLNAILVEMDGFGTDEGIIVVAATNRPDVLDPALLRPGRFDREVTIDLPDLEGRQKILEVHLKRVKARSDVDAGVLARSTPGYSGADLSAIVNEAAIMAVLAKEDEITMEHLEEARDKVRYGRQKKSRKIEEQDRKITAYHEAGHAVVAAQLPETDHPHKVTIVPRGRALGATMILPDKESYHMQKRRLLAQLAMLFGGRVAEEEFCGDISAGASDDISRATEIARAMVTELGMSEKIGPISYAERQGSDFLGTELMRSRQHSEETAREIDQEIRKILDEAYARARSVIRENRTGVESLTVALLTYETISGQEVQRLLQGASVDGLRPPKKDAGAEPERRPAAEPRRAEKPSEGEDPAGGLLGPTPA
jgi:cell division protease FtsH